MKGTLGVGYDNFLGTDERRVKYSPSVNFSYNRNVGFLNGRKYNSVSYSISPQIRLDYSVEDLFRFKPNYRLTYSESRYDINQKRNRSYNNHGIGLEVSSYWPKNVVFSNDLSWNYYGNVTPGFENSALLWSLSLGYQFLNDKASLNLNIYDLLNQNIDTRRIIGDDYIQDINSLILNRYFMLSFTYNLGKFGKGAGSNSGGAFRVLGN